MHFTIPVEASFVTFDDISTAITAKLTALNFAGNVTCMSIEVAPDTKIRSDGKDVGCRLLVELEEGNNR